MVIRVPKHFFEARFSLKVVRRMMVPFQVSVNTKVPCVALFNQVFK